MLEVAPVRTAKSVFGELQGRYPVHFRDVQLRTLQRRVKQWREKSLVEFDDGWLRGEVLAGAVPPHRLRVSIEPQGVPMGGEALTGGHPQVVCAAQPTL